MVDVTLPASVWELGRSTQCESMRGRHHAVVGRLASSRGAIIRRLALEVMWPHTPSAVPTCRHLSAPVTTCRHHLPVWGPCRRSPQSALPAAQDVMRRPMAGGHRAGWSVGTEPAPGRSSSNAPPQVATPVVPYGCRSDRLLQACAMRSRPARSRRSHTKVRRMEAREDTHMDQTTHALPAHTRADGMALLNARLTDRMDLMHHAKPVRGHGKGPRATRRRGRATAATAGVFGLVLLAALCDAQTVPAAGAEASVSNPLPAKLRAAADADANRPLRTVTIMTQRDPLPSTATPAVRPFHIRVPEEALVDLRRRLAATRWPERETVDDASQGVQLATLQALVRYWGTDYDWRKARRSSMPCRSSSRRSTAWTSTSSTFARVIQTRCR